MIYLDAAATSWPKPEAVYRAMDRFAREEAANPGKGGHLMSRRSAERIAGTRDRLSRLLNAPDPSRIVLTLNATDALNIAIKGVLRKGDHVVTSVLEHFSVSRPIAAMERAGSVTVTRVEPDAEGSIPPEAVRDATTDRTRLLALTHCSNVIGVVNPPADYAKIARDHGALLLLDAAQTGGIVKIDVQESGVDLVALTGHKNLLGPMGTGALYVREGLTLEPWREGASGPKPDAEFHPEEMPFRLEGGTPNAPGLVGLGAGLEFIEKVGEENIRTHKRDLAFRFMESIRGNERIHFHGGANPERHIGTVSLTIDGVKPKEAGTILDEKYKIACRPGLHCAPGAHKRLGTFPEGTIRFSFGYFNTEEHVEAASKAVLEIAGGK